MNTRTSKAMAVAITCLFAAAVGCTDTTVEPVSTVPPSELFSDPASYAKLLAKAYGGLALTGQQRDGAPDIRSNDEGFMSYTRLLFNMQELPTDEVWLNWGDFAVQEINRGQWGVTNTFLQAMYYRIYFVVSITNEFLRQTTDAVLDGRGQTDATFRANIKQYRAEARFLRALVYWHGIDLFARIPLVTEADPVNGPPPSQADRDSTFRYIVSELQAIIPDLPAAGTSDQNRATGLAAQMLLAKVLLNHAVYLGAPSATTYTQAMTAVQAVIGGPYTLAANYRWNFTADNNTSPEIIFAVTSDGLRTQNYGGTTFMIHATCGGYDDGSPGGSPEVTLNEVGLQRECWWGITMKPDAYNNYFPPNNVAGDTARTSFFHTAGRLPAAAACLQDCFNEGIGVPKYVNWTRSGIANGGCWNALPTPTCSGADRGSDGYFPDTDFPMFRLADAYLMYAELFLRGGGGTQAQALTYVNALRQRSYGNTSGDITGAQLTLDFILAERGRELLMEAQRRTDLIRFGKFTGATYLWAWKGGVQAGATIPAYRDVYPLPASELTANPNLTQNTGY